MTMKSAVFIALFACALVPNIANAQGVTHFRHLSADGDGEQQLILTCNASHRCDIEEISLGRFHNTRECLILRRSWRRVRFQRSGSVWIGRARASGQRWEFRVEFSDATPTSLNVVYENRVPETTTYTWSFELAPSAAFDTRGCDSVSGIWPDAN